MPTQRPDPVHRQFTARLQNRLKNAIQLLALEQVQSLGFSRAQVFPTTHIGHFHRGMVGNPALSHNRSIVRGVGDARRKGVLSRLHG